MSSIKREISRKLSKTSDEKKELEEEVWKNENQWDRLSTVSNVYRFPYLYRNGLK